MYHFPIDNQHDYNTSSTFIFKVIIYRPIESWKTAYYTVVCPKLNGSP